MSDLEALLERLRKAQSELIAAAARIQVLPSDSTLRKIADLEIAIGAVEHEIEEQREKR